MITARSVNSAGFLSCVLLLGYAYVAQYHLHLEPCPLCIFQRVGVLALGAVFLVASIHDPKRSGRQAYAVLIAIAALSTCAIAIRHIYIQSLPEGSVPACGASLQFMMKVLPLSEVLTKVLSGSGECAKVNWRFLGLTMPACVLIAAIVLGSVGIWANRARRAPAVRF